jgi:hypothetical protein
MCSAPLRRTDGSLPRAAVAVLLGLTAATIGPAACGRGVVVEGSGVSAASGVSVGSGAVAYGIAETGTSGPGGAAGVGGAGGAPGAGGPPGTGGVPASAYGIAVTVGAGGSDAGN